MQVCLNIRMWSQPCPEHAISKILLYRWRCSQGRRQGSLAHSRQAIDRQTLHAVSATKFLLKLTEHLTTPYQRSSMQDTQRDSGIMNRRIRIRRRGHGWLFEQAQLLRALLEEQT